VVSLGWFHFNSRCLPAFALSCLLLSHLLLLSMGPRVYRSRSPVRSSSNIPRSHFTSHAGPKSVDTVQDLRVTTIVTNTGNETLKLLNDPSSPLSTIPADTFRITNGLSDVAPIFTGVKVKYVPGVAAIQKAYTVLAPGESIRVDHDCE